MDLIVQQRIEEWCHPPFDKDTINEIQDLIRRNDKKEIHERFYKMLDFGTGGLRGVIGAGTNRMNIYTVGMATQGLAHYIRQNGGEKAGVVIARDSRRMSDAFAREAAAILAANGICVYFFDDITPTPICSFAIRELRAVSGIVITASHNPPEYNGYKVYWDDGGQVVPPHDSEIIEEVRKIDSIGTIKKTSFDDAVKSGLITIIGNDITERYISRLETKALRPAKASGTSIVYTPLHGTGYTIIPKVLRRFGFENIHLVEPQARPDGNFPTVKSPNPEEREALTLAIELAKKVNADIFLATDPDADRMGVGFRTDTGAYEIINGNQIGAMLEYYMLLRLSQTNRLPENAAIVKTIVTSDIQDKIAQGFNCSVDNVLTGFKWIAMKMKEYDVSASRTFVFGGEESYGYLPVDFVRDKDSISSCYFFTEMVDWLKENGKTPGGFLDEIYRRFGLYLEDLHSITLKGVDGMEKIGVIMKSFRNSPPSDFDGTPIRKIVDMKHLTVTDTSTGERTPVTGLPGSNVLQFFLDDGSKITMRPSGTEPKIKFYFSVNRDVTHGNIDDAKLELKRKIEGYKKDLNARVASL